MWTFDIIKKFIIDWSSTTLVIQTAKHLTDEKGKIHNMQILRKVEFHVF